MKLISTGAACVLIALACPQPASAELTLLSDVGVWSAYGGTTHNGTPVCGMAVANTARSFHIKAFRGGDGLELYISKAGWNIPEKAESPISVQFDRAAPLTGVALRHNAKGDALSLGIPPDAMTDFLNLVRYSARMTVTFTAGTEAPWQTEMTGSNAAVLAMTQCAEAWTPPKQTQPFAAPQPYAPLQKPAMQTQPYERAL